VIANLKTPADDFKMLPVEPGKTQLDRQIFDPAVVTGLQTNPRRTKTNGLGHATPPFFEKRYGNNTASLCSI
jgi:hypothetical protein